MASRQESAAVVIRRARELAVAGCGPTTIEALLAAGGYPKTSQLITDSFAEEVDGQLKRESAHQTHPKVNRQ